jgi:uncharacterized protein
MDRTALTRRRDERSLAASAGRSRPGIWRLVAGVEVVLAATAVLLDLAVPTLVVLGLMVVSLLVRRQRLAAMGFSRVPRPWAFAGKMLAFAAGWTLVNLGLLMPLENRLTGTRQDMSEFMALRGNVAMLVTLLVLSWTVAALGEELAYRGFVLTRLTELIGSTRLRVAVAVLLSSVLFGFAHAEQGLVGSC